MGLHVVDAHARAGEARVRGHPLGVRHGVASAAGELRVDALLIHVDAAFDVAGLRRAGRGRESRAACKAGDGMGMKRGEKAEEAQWRASQNSRCLLTSAFGLSMVLKQ